MDHPVHRGRVVQVGRLGRVEREEHREQLAQVELPGLLGRTVLRVPLVRRDRRGPVV
jgi:hypothetical protein